MASANRFQRKRNKLNTLREKVSRLVSETLNPESSASFVYYRVLNHCDRKIYVSVFVCLFQSRADSEGKVLYSLYGVIQHSGNMNSGHYTAYVKVSEPPLKSLYDKITSMSELTDFIEKMWTQKSEAQHGSSRTHHEPAPSGQWFHVSDSSVSAAAESKVLKSQAYMLFYGRLPLVSG